MKLVITLSMLLLCASTVFSADLPAYNVRAAGDLKVDGTLYLKDGTPIVSSDGLLKNRGPFVLGTSYFAGDVVQSGGSSYVCKATNQSEPLTNDGTFWSVMATQGATGAAGSQGLKGDKGDTGATGPAGQVTLTSICAAIVAGGSALPTFCPNSNLVGTWLGSEVGGASGWSFVFDNSSYVTVTQAGFAMYSGQATVNSSVIPNTVDFYFANSSYAPYVGLTSLGIYSISGNQMTMAANEPGGSVRPASLAAVVGTRVFNLTKQ